VLAQGVGPFTPASVAYNLVDPVARNTIAVPGGGWAVIRFVANNPGTFTDSRLSRRFSPNVTWALMLFWA